MERKSFVKIARKLRIKQENILSWMEEQRAKIPDPRPKIIQEISHQQQVCPHKKTDQPAIQIVQTDKGKNILRQLESEVSYQIPVQTSMPNTLLSKIRSLFTRPQE